MIFRLKQRWADCVPWPKDTPFTRGGINSTPARLPVAGRKPDPELSETTNGRIRRPDTPALLLQLAHTLRDTAVIVRGEIDHFPSPY